MSSNGPRSNTTKRCTSSCSAPSIIHPAQCRRRPCISYLRARLPRPHQRRDGARASVDPRGRGFQRADVCGHLVHRLLRHAPPPGSHVPGPRQHLCGGARSDTGRPRAPSLGFESGGRVWARAAACTLCLPGSVYFVFATTMIQPHQAIHDTCPTRPQIRARMSETKLRLKGGQARAAAPPFCGRLWTRIKSPGLFFIKFCEPFSGCLSLPLSLPGEVWGGWCVFFVLTLTWISSLWVDVWFHSIVYLLHCSSQVVCHLPFRIHIWHGPLFWRLLVVVSSILWHGRHALRVLMHVQIDALIALRELPEPFQPLQPILKSLRFDSTSR